MPLIKIFLRATLGPEMTQSVMNAVEKFLHEKNTTKFISKMYQLLLKGSPKPGLHKSKTKWEPDLNMKINDICSTQTGITGVHVLVDPELRPLENLESIHGLLNKTQLKFTQLALCVAKKCLVVSWKSDSSILTDGWLVEIKSRIPLEKNRISSQKTIQRIF